MTPPGNTTDWPFIDLFSGCGGFSYGFKARTPFRPVAAVDYEQGKPSTKKGKSGCNQTYLDNIGIAPKDGDINQLPPEELRDRIPDTQREIVILLCSPPCTNFSKIRLGDRSVDGPTNSLVGRTAKFVEHFMPEFVVMENTPGLLNGRHRHHYEGFESVLTGLGYQINANVFRFDKFGLPQIRERAIVVAARDKRPLNLDDLWDGWEVASSAITVRRAIDRLNSPAITAGAANTNDPVHEAPGFSRDSNVHEFIQNIPHDGGSWKDLMQCDKTRDLVIPSARKRFDTHRSPGYGDVYGRLWWDKPSVTIKRECSHVGNGRYTHPDQDRLLTMREMSILQGFPRDYEFGRSARTNTYRQIGDAIPPLISYQISAVVAWMKTGIKPEIPQEWLLPNTSIHSDDISRTPNVHYPLL